MLHIGDMQPAMSEFNEVVQKCGSGSRPATGKSVRWTFQFGDPFTVVLGLRFDSIQAFVYCRETGSHFIPEIIDSLAQQVGVLALLMNPWQ